MQLFVIAGTITVALKLLYLMYIILGWLFCSTRVRRMFEGESIFVCMSITVCIILLFLQGFFGSIIYFSNLENKERIFSFFLCTDILAVGIGTIIYACTNISTFREYVAKKRGTRAW